jgi:hypothetical protein
VKLTLFAAVMTLLLVGCAHQEVEYAPAYGYGGGMAGYGDCVYPDPCGGYWPYDSEGFYPAPGSGFERHPVQLSQRRPPTRKVTRSSVETTKRENSSREVRTVNHSAPAGHSAPSSPSTHVSASFASSAAHSAGPASSSHR